MIQRIGNAAVNGWSLVADVYDFINGFEAPRDWEKGDLAFLMLLCGAENVADPFQLVTADDDPLAFGIDVMQMISPDLIFISAWMNADEGPRSMAIDWDRLIHTPEVVKPQICYSVQPCSGTDNAYELCRFMTPKGHVGLITSCQTSVTFTENGFPWPPGDPHYYARTFGGGTGEANLGWALMIETINEHNINPNNLRIRAVPAAQEFTHNLPGIVHDDMQPWRAMLFLWGWDHQVHWRCPPNSAVSLWVAHLPIFNPAGVWELGGMMKGHTQVSGSPRTYKNMCRGRV